VSSGGSRQVGARCGRGSVGDFGPRCQSVGGPRRATLFGEGSRRLEGASAYACCAVRVRVLEADVGREAVSARSIPANAAEATVAVMRHGCQRGESFEGCERAVAEACVGARRPSGRRVPPWRKRSEPCTAVGCNKPTPGSEAQSAEVVQNHEGGTHRPGTVDASWRMESPAGEGPAAWRVVSRAFTRTNPMAGGQLALSRLPRGIP